MALRSISSHIAVVGSAGAAAAKLMHKQIDSVSHLSASETVSGAEQERVAVPAATKVITLLAVVLPFIGLAVAVGTLWGVGFSWVHLGILLGMYVVTVIGVTVGYHRLFTHRSFQTNAVVKAFLAISGSMAAEGPLLRWVAMHRRHHQHSDEHEDPHSPHVHGKGLMAILKGFWHAHVGWLFAPDAPQLDRYAGDLRRDALLRKISGLFPVWVAVGLVLPCVLGGLLTLSWSGALLGLLWGGLVRIFLVHHVTWSINSVCHLWGRRPFESRDESRNNVIFGVLAMGEGWHNNHHAFPTSARHGLRWWQIDVSYLLIRGLEICGLAREVRVPALATMEAKRRND